MLQSGACLVYCESARSVPQRSAIVVVPGFELVQLCKSSSGVFIASSPFTAAGLIWWPKVH